MRVYGVLIFLCMMSVSSQAYKKRSSSMWSSKRACAAAVAGECLTLSFLGYALYCAIKAMRGRALARKKVTSVKPRLSWWGRAGIAGALAAIAGLATWKMYGKWHAYSRSSVENGNALGLINDLVVKDYIGVDVVPDSFSEKALAWEPLFLFKKKRLSARIS